MKYSTSPAVSLLRRAIPCLIVLLICLPVIACAQDAVPSAPSIGETISKMMPVILVSFFVFYFMVIKPQNQKLQSQKTLFATLAKGDTVITTGGIIAKVAVIEGPYVTLEVSPQVRIKFEAEHIKQKFEEVKTEDKK